MKRMLDVLCPKIESQFKLWSSRIADGGNAVIGEHLSEITVMMRAKFRNYLLAVVEKFAENVSIFCILASSFNRGIYMPLLIDCFIGNFRVTYSRHMTN